VRGVRLPTRLVAIKRIRLRGRFGYATNRKV